MHACMHTYNHAHLHAYTLTYNTLTLIHIHTYALTLAHTREHYTDVPMLFFLHAETLIKSIFFFSCALPRCDVQVLRGDH
jgi:hypothetical protein